MSGSEDITLFMKIICDPNSRHVYTFELQSTYYLSAFIPLSNACKMRQFLTYILHLNKYSYQITHETGYTNSNFSIRILLKRKKYIYSDITRSILSKI